ncbi:hypothetical protein M409DRAFT_68665 [Zasmidium cellare ATCC 36951]|uniref:2-dehydropantoate 2-reductase n=1 Tax=Zasmidium cellare ATCC 36951 TaxID=1080233 RepID=A0A6A6C7J6_ZASCE|nr:uncharacterized protein M409DRAFT_68665 [Zasmidium cellare ATCC 36951]KAF2163021.1 hypothetical protein M409DRAFT_68665 [Zasmidium cellare ATCC 36951]
MIDNGEDVQAQEKTEEETLRESLSAIDRQYAAQPNVERRIHIVGTGSIGKLVAHSLRGIPNPPPVTLIFHRYKVLHAWERSPKVITVQDGEYKVPRDGFDAEFAPGNVRQHGVEIPHGTQNVYEAADQAGVPPHEMAKVFAEREKEAAAQKQEEDSTAGYTPMMGAHGSESSERRPLPGDYAESPEIIHNLILTTKTIRTISALSRIRHRLNRDSTICFLQNGMGVIDDVNEQLFPDPATRPNYVQGIISHGANVPPEMAERDPFFVVHAGHGTLSLGAIPREPTTATADRPPTPTGFGTDNDGHMSESQIEEWSPSARYMLRTLTRTPVLCAVGFTPIELLQLQLEKLAVNSIMNPLTSLIDNRNGALLYNFPLSRTMRLMLAETSLVMRSLPELRGIPNVPHRFSAERLETLVVSVSNKTRDNVSSMLADIRNGNQTEIEYINGYIVKRGEELGVKCVVNYAIMQTVLGKSLMARREYQDSVPVEGQRSRNHQGINPDL